MDMIIRGDQADFAPHRRYRGAGMVSGNNSSRLLMDYRTESPAAYEELLQHIFGADGVGVNHLKLEMGSDVNSSSGTEPAVKRSAEERADVTRGAGYQLAKDAKRVNPDLTLDLLFWSDTRWVTDAKDVYAARYQWYRETLIAAYETYGLRFDYVSLSRNERAIDPAWICYCAKRLKEETACPYDFSQIRIVAADEENSWHICDLMLADPVLCKAVDVIGSHYTSHGTEATLRLAEEYGKEIWMSESSAPMKYAAGSSRFDADHSGLSGINGLLDIANRMITMYPGGRMTLYEYQPVVSAYYNGVTYGHKHLILANEPWSGCYQLDSGYLMALHFSRFFKKGWTFLPDACIADGKKGGDGHAIVDATHSIMTAADPATGDYSVVMTNTTDKPMTYRFAVSALQKADAPLYVWETRGADQGDFDENYFCRREVICPTEENGVYRWSVTLAPASLVTVSTLRTAERPVHAAKSRLLSLPYADDFSYPADALAFRGGAPRYTTDQGGAFEVGMYHGRRALIQQITEEMRAEEWGFTPNPTTNFGDDRWFRYRITAEVGFANTDHENYVGVGLRYALACIGQSGYWMQLFADGRWQLRRNDGIVATGRIGAFDGTALHRITVSAEDGTVTAAIDGQQTVVYEEPTAWIGAGRAALYSAFARNCFTFVTIEPIGTAYSITRSDNTDALCTYSGDWAHCTMSGFRHFNRTISSGSAGASVQLSFAGSGFLLTGEQEEPCVISLTVDGVCICAEQEIAVCGVGEASCFCTGLDCGAHTAEITVIQGKFAFDSVQVIG